MFRGVDGRRRWRLASARRGWGDDEEAVAPLPLHSLWDDDLDRQPAAAAPQRVARGVARVCRRADRLGRNLHSPIVVAGHAAARRRRGRERRGGGHPARHGRRAAVMTRGRRSERDRVAAQERCHQQSQAGEPHASGGGRQSAARRAQFVIGFEINHGQTVTGFPIYNPRCCNAR